MLSYSRRLHPLYYHMQHINDLTCRYFLQLFSNPWWLWWRCWKLAIWHFYFLSASWWSCQGSIIVIMEDWLGLPRRLNFNSSLEVTSHQHFSSSWEICLNVSVHISPLVLCLDINDKYHYLNQNQLSTNEYKINYVWPHSFYFPKTWILIVMYSFRIWIEGGLR